MKTRAFLLLCIITALAGTNVKAQNGISKFETINPLKSVYMECTGDYLFGSVIVENILSSHNWVAKIRDNELVGYKDPEGNNPSGNIYQYDGTSPGLNNYVATGHFRLNGKVIAEYQFHYHLTINANGEPTVEFYTVKFKCL